MAALANVYGIRLLWEPGFRRAALVLLLVLVLGFRALQFLALTAQVQWGYDFSAYWQAAGRVLAGDALYAPFQLDGPYSPQQQFLYLYPPFLAVVVAPLAALFDDYRAAAWAWTGIGAAVLLVAVLLVARQERFGSRDRLLLVGVAFAFAPVVGELVMGNVHLLLLGLLAGAWVALARGTPRGEVAAGALVGVAALIKVFPGLVILWFLLTRRYRAALASVAVMGLLALVTLPVTGIGPWLDYPIVLANLGPPVELTDVLAPTAWLSAVLPALLARVLVTAVGLAVVAWAARNRPAPVGFAIAVAVSILVAPALYQHYLAVLVLPMFLAIRHAPPVGWVALAWLLMSGGEQSALGDAAWIVNRAMPTLGALLVVVGLLRFRGRLDQVERSSLEGEPGG